MNRSSLGIESSKLDYIAFKRGCIFDAHRAIAVCMAVAVVLAISHNEEAPPMLRLLESVSELSFELWARRAPFDAKDAMKARGYRLAAAANAGTAMFVARIWRESNGVGCKHKFMAAWPRALKCLCSTRGVATRRARALQWSRARSRRTTHRAISLRPTRLRAL